MLATLLALPLVFALVYSYRVRIESAKLDFGNKNFLLLSLARESLRTELAAVYQALYRIAIDPVVVEAAKAKDGQLSPEDLRTHLPILDGQTKLLGLYVLTHGPEGPARILLSHQRTTPVIGHGSDGLWLDRNLGNDLKALKKSVVGVQKKLAKPKILHYRRAGLSGPSYEAARTFDPKMSDAFLFAMPIYDDGDQLVGQVTGVYWTERFRTSLSNLPAALVVPETELCLYSEPYFKPEAEEQTYLADFAPWFAQGKRPPDLIFSSMISFKAGDAGGNWRLVAALPDEAFYAGSQAANARYALALGLASTLILVFLSQLLLLKEAAVASQKARGLFLAQMSHEIRTPINGILGMTRLAQRTDLDETQREYLSAVQQSGESLLGIINDILDLSKIESGVLSYNEEPVDPLEVAHKAIRTVVSRVGDKPVELLLEVEGPVPREIAIDPDRLRQVLLNLLSNAAKFTHRGHVTLRLTQSQNILKFAVEDSGIGIADDKLEKIFDAFSQAEDTTTREYGGTGLGLAISAKLADRMGGPLRVESELGHGSTFFFEIEPTVVQGLPPPEPLEEPVVIYSDSQELLSSCGRNLSEQGIRSQQAQNPDSFWGHLLTLENPRLVVDGNKMDDDLLRRLKQDYPEAIFLLDSDHLKEQQTMLKRHEFSNFLVKPVHPRRLENQLRGELEKNVEKRSETLRTANSLRILVAEDNPINRTLVEILLTDLGHQVTLVEDGVDALTACKSGRWDLVLMDLQMPKMDGLEATRLIREWEKGVSKKRVPILALTAQALSGDREKCLEAGMDGYLSKPIDEAALNRELEQLAVSPQPSMS